MKYSIVIIPLILQFFLFSQDYQTVRPEYTAFFNQTNTIRIDSITQSGDTTFLHNLRMIRGDNDYWCYNLYGDSWTGKPIIILPSGLNLFVNKETDTISIDTQAKLGDERLFYSYPDGRYIVSTVSDHDTVSFFGLSDSVKTITLQVKDLNGNNIVSPMNERFLKLSKNYGFINILDFYDFPYVNYDENNLYYFNPDSYLIGTANLGYQNFGAEEIFDFNIDDEFHIYDYSIHLFNEFPSTKEYFILKVIEKTVGNSTVHYHYDRCYRKEYTDYQNPQNSYILFQLDTTEETIDFTDFEMKRLGYCSYEPYTFDGFQWEFLRGKMYCQDAFTGEPDCMEMVIFDPIDCYSYLKGLGGPYYEGQGAFEPHYYGRELVYYKKGNQWLGNPYNCDELSYIDGIPEVPHITVYPNPAKEFISLELSGIHPKNTKLLIQTFEGKQLLSGQNLSESMKIDISGLQNGIYLIIIETEKEHYIQKLLIAR
jgi:hypothetical protein